MSIENTVTQSSTQPGQAGAKMISMLESNRDALVKIVAAAESERTRQLRERQLDGLAWVLTEYRERLENVSTEEELEAVYQEIEASSAPQHEYGVEFVKYRKGLAR